MRFTKPHWLLLVAYPYWLVWDVTLDTLVNDSAAPVQEVTIKDKTLFDKVRLIDELPEQEKNMILQVIDLALSKKKFKDLVQKIG